MEEGEKFIRHIIPGLIFMLFTGIQLHFSIPNEVYNSIADLNTSSAIITVFALGGIGYVFSNIYFVTTHLIGFTVNHKDFVERLISNNKIKIIFPEKTSKEINDEKAWTIINIIWYISLQKVEMERVTIPINRLSNILHGIGITFVAVLFSIIIGFITYFSLGCECNLDGFILSSSISIIFLIYLGANYFISKRKYYSFVNSAVETAINKVADKPMEIVVHYSE